MWSGGSTALIVIMRTILDIMIGTSLGGGLSGIPNTAIGRFAQFQDNRLLGLYNLDLLNLCTTILKIPTYFALWAAHRKVNIVKRWQSYVKLWSKFENRQIKEQQLKAGKVSASVMHEPRYKY